MKDHKMRLHYTKLVKYDGTNIIIEEIYSGEELSRKYGKKELREKGECPIPKRSGDKSSLEKGLVSKVSKYVTTAVTTSDDPPQWWQNYDYPQWMWNYIEGNYVKSDPINLAWYWDSVSKSMVKEEINDGATDEWFDDVLEDRMYIYDKDHWEIDDAMATNPLHVVRTHLRLWTIYTNDVVGGVHHETLFGVNDFEDSERRVLDEFDDSIVPEVTNDIEYCWEVSVDSYWLNNAVTDPASNNGWASEVW